MIGLVGLLGAAASAGCAAQPALGVRAEFARTRVTSVTLAPFSSAGAFGMSERGLAMLLERYELEAAQALSGLGVQVTDPRALTHALTELGSWSTFVQGVAMTQALDRYFEGQEVASLLPAQTLQALAEQGALQGPLLFGHVLYHSHAACRVSAWEGRARDARVVVRVEPGARQTLPRPCVISHAQLKLVEPRTGRAMWFNQTLLERHVADADEAARSYNIRVLMGLVLRGERGLEALTSTP